MTATEDQASIESSSAPAGGTVVEPARWPAGRPERPAGRLLGIRGRTAAMWRDWTAEAAWAPVAFLGVLALAAVLYIWNLTVSDYANTYYSAAALAGSQSWSAWFFGSFDANNFITVDKPPFSTMVMGLSVRLLGLSPWSILLPEALAGVATVGVLFLTVKRAFGPAAATIAGVVMALTPAAVLIFRFNNPDGMLTLLLVISAWALLRAIDHGSLRWMTLAAALIGLAFLTKYLQAYLVLPGYALVFGFSANTTLRRRIIGLSLSLATVLVTSGWWVAIVQLLPADARPFIGGSTTGSPLDLIFGYDGLGRIFGATGPGGGVGGGANFSGEVGLFRLFNDQIFGQIAWFIPLALVCLIVGLWYRRWAHRTDLALASYLLWGGWFVISAIVFSYMSGIIHSYYAVALAPAVAALVGAGLADLWKARVSFGARTSAEDVSSAAGGGASAGSEPTAGSGIWFGGAAVGLACLATAWFGAQLLDRTAGFAPGVGQAAIELAAAAFLTLILISLPGLRANPAVRRLGTAAAALGLGATLLAPGAYAWTTMQNAYGGGDPHPGPGANGDSGFANPGGLGGGIVPPGGNGGIGIGNPGSRLAGPGDTALLQYLVANRGSASWIVAASGASQAGAIELATRLPVMAMGGFTGSDPAPTLDQLRSYFASGKLRFILLDGAGGGGFGFGAGASDNRTTWVIANCKIVEYGGTGTGASLYDCSSAA